ncbi:MAG TPA: hypothetical protein VI934_03720 [Candidatus Nanoarchaeia archaeon]|nr:hypothetical protein [Candidatus Nanoarchaeia archaeon]
MTCQMDKPIKLKKTDKPCLIIDRQADTNVIQELVRIEYKEQLKYYARFLSNFISNKNSVKYIVGGCRWTLKDRTDTCSSMRLKDKLSTIDFYEHTDNGILYVFLVIAFKKKPKKWLAQDYFRD